VLHEEEGVRLADHPAADHQRSIHEKHIRGFCVVLRRCRRPRTPASRRRQLGRRDRLD
jgi:hypothetical protein